MRVVYNKPNIVLAGLTLLFIGLFVFKTGRNKSIERNLIQKVDTLTKQTDILKHKVDSISKLNVVLQKNLILFRDSIYKYKMNLVKPDSKSSYWFVTANSSISEYFTVIKLKTNVFSIVDAQEFMLKRYNDTTYFYIKNFIPISEYCYLQYFDKYLKNKYKE